MRRKNMFLTVLLVLLSAAGIVLAFLFLRRESELDAERQMKVAQLSQELQPINEERKQWEAQDKEWQDLLLEKQKGKPCVLLNFDNMSENLYETIYDMMEQYGFRGTFAFRNNRLPGWDEDSITRDEFDELMHDGWEYALSIGEEHVVDETLSYWERLEERESETETEAQADPEGEEEETKSYLEQLDDFIGVLQDNGVVMPQTLFCDGEQYAHTTEIALAERGFRMVCVKNEDEFPVLTGRGEKIWQIDCGIYTQQDTDIEQELERIIESGSSAAIFINDVQKLSQDASYDLSLTRFTSLLNCLKRMEEEGKIYLLTYTELDQYDSQLAKEYKQLTKKYAAFHQEMETALEELDQQEAEIVARARETEEEKVLFEQIKKQLGIGADEKETEQPYIETDEETEQDT